VRALGQGDETNNPINLFLEAVDQDPEKLHPYYKIVRDDPGHEPARLVLSELALWLAPAEPHAGGMRPANPA
jgi:hypothetical protein